MPMFKDLVPNFPLNAGESIIHVTAGKTHAVVLTPAQTFVVRAVDDFIDYESEVFSSRSEATRLANYLDPAEARTTLD